jgi:hypothetical protein
MQTHIHSALSQYMAAVLVHRHWLTLAFCY